MELKLGVYEHYKGNKYLVLGLAYHSETLEHLVVYVPLYAKSGAMWVRPVSMWNEEVSWQGHAVPRFRYLGLELEKPSPD